MLHKSRSISFSRRRSGFTLIELLTVVAVIGILASILIPVVGGARKTALKAKSRAQFGGWAGALVAYKNEYGYFPNIGSLASGSKLTLNENNSKQLVVALSGRELTSGGPNVATYNPRRRPFYSFSESEYLYDANANNEANAVTEGVLVDAFNNPNINILVDHNGDGKIDTTKTGLKTNIHGLGSDYRGEVMIWTEKDSGDGFEDVMSWK